MENILHIGFISALRFQDLLNDDKLDFNQFDSKGECFLYKHIGTRDEVLIRLEGSEALWHRARIVVRIEGLSSDLSLDIRDLEARHLKQALIADIFTKMFSQLITAHYANR